MVINFNHSRLKSDLKKVTTKFANLQITFFQVLQLFFHSLLFLYNYLVFMIEVLRVLQDQIIPG